MKNTYTRTVLVENLEEAEVELSVLSGCRYTCKGPIEVRTIKYTGLTSYDIIEGGKEAEEIEADLNEDDMDEYHEYLVLHFNDGSTSTFRNTHVVMFVR